MQFNPLYTTGSSILACRIILKRSWILRALGLLSYRLMQQAMGLEPVLGKALAGGRPLNATTTNRG